jgi:hypothetical protein
MKFKIITSITAILTFINAILFLALPGYTMSILGGSLTSTGFMNTRIAGACALGLSLVLFAGQEYPFFTHADFHLLELATALAGSGCY